MKPITDTTAIARFQRLVDEMTVPNGAFERDFDDGWSREHVWKVVPVETERSHFSPQEIDRIVPALNSSGYNQCFAVATEPLDPLPSCYQVIISRDDLVNFNRECALLRYLLTDEARSWAISCYGGYKLFAGSPAMLESLLGEPIPAARKRFWDFVQILDHGDPESLLLKTASRYDD